MIKLEIWIIQELQIAMVLLTVEFEDHHLCIQMHIYFLKTGKIVIFVELSSFKKEREEKKRNAGSLATCIVVR